MINGVFIIRSGGIRFAHLDDGNATKGEIDLMAPFFSALDAFTNESFKGTIKGIILEDDIGMERHIFFKNNKVHGLDYKVVVVTSGRSISQKESKLPL